MLSGAALSPIWCFACLVCLGADWVVLHWFGGGVLLYAMRVSGVRVACVGRLYAWALNC